MKKQSASEEDSNCCENKKIHIDDLDEDYTSPMMVELVDHSLEVCASCNLQFIASDIVQKEIISYTSYRPPPPDTDFQVLYQVYLI